MEEQLKQIQEQVHGLGLVMQTFSKGLLDLENLLYEKRGQNLKGKTLPHPCDGPLYEKWSAVDYLCKAQEECGEIGEAFGELHRDRDNVEKWTHLMRECCDGIVAITGLMHSCGCKEEARQAFMREINTSNATRDDGLRFKQDTGAAGRL